MSNQRSTDEEFIAAWKKLGSPTLVAQHFRMSYRAVLGRRRNIEIRHDIKLPTVALPPVNGDILQKQRQLESLPKPKSPVSRNDPAILSNVFTIGDERWRYNATIHNGIIVIGSDAHYFPKIISTAHRALIHLVSQLKPAMVVLNGDILDAATASKHFRIRWHTQPSIKDELETVRDRLAEIEAVAGNAKLVRTWGNHDSRFESRLSENAPQYEGVGGFRLEDHLPRWTPCMSVHVNDDLVIKHRFKGGLHAVHNNTLWAGRSMVTGHLHSLKVMPITDYNGTRYGVDSGTLASPLDDAFHYAEDDPRNWRSGFVVLNFINGTLMPPELCHVIDDGHVYFRGERIAV